MRSGSPRRCTRLRSRSRSGRESRWWSRCDGAALSIPSTIAEGAGRLGRRELIHFVSISMASAAELESQLLLARTVRLFPEERVTSLLGDVVSVRRMEAAFIKRLRQAERPRKPSKLEARHDADSSDAR